MPGKGLTGLWQLLCGIALVSPDRPRSISRRCSSPRKNAHLPGGRFFLINLGVYLGVDEIIRKYFKDGIIYFKLDHPYVYYEWSV